MVGHLVVVIPYFGRRRMFRSALRRLSGLLFRLVGGRGVTGGDNVVFISSKDRSGAEQLVSTTRGGCGRICNMLLTGGMKRRGTLITKLRATYSVYSIAVAVSTSLRSSVFIVRRVLSGFVSNYSVICNIESSHGGSDFFGHASTRLFCGFVGLVNIGAMGGRTSFHLLDRHTMGRLSGCGRHGLFLEKVIARLNCGASYICCTEGGHATKRAGCPLGGVLGFTFRNVASFDTEPVGLVLTLKLIVVFFSFLTLLCILVSCFSNGTNNN